MYRFEIWIAVLPYQEGSHVIRGPHPVIIVLNDTVNARSPLLTVIPLTSNLKRFAMMTHVLIRGQGLHHDSLALCEQIMPLDKMNMIQRVGYVSNEYDRYALIQGVGAQLGLA